MSGKPNIRFLGYGLALAASGTLIVSGCSRGVVPAAPVVMAAGQRTRQAAAPLPDPEAQAAASMARQPLYRQAQAACAQKRYRQAADLLERLAQTKGLSVAEANFCREQRVLCLKDAGLPIPQAAVSFRKSVAAPSPLPSDRTQTPEQADCGPRALLVVCRKLGVKATLAQLRQAAGTTGKGTSLAGLQQAAQAVGLKAEGVQVSREALAQVDGPAIAWVNGSHFDAVLGMQGEGESATATIRDPNAAQEQTLSQERLLSLCSGYLLLVHR